MKVVKEPTNYGLVHNMRKFVSCYGKHDRLNKLHFQDI